MPTRLAHRLVVKGPAESSRPRLLPLRRNGVTALRRYDRSTSIGNRLALRGDPGIASDPAQVLCSGPQGPRSIARTVRFLWQGSSRGRERSPNGAKLGCCDNVRRAIWSSSSWTGSVREAWRLRHLRRHQQASGRRDPGAERRAARCDGVVGVFSPTQSRACRHGCWSMRPQRTPISRSPFYEPCRPRRRMAAVFLRRDLTLMEWRAAQSQTR